jgi:predicted aconitase
MGGIENYSCTPYFGENLPKRGDIVAWAESNAVNYINSVIGAKTNRTSVFIDLFSAVLGFTPNFGLLIDENRKADYEIILDVNTKIDYSLLGYLIGEKLIDKIPYIRGLACEYDDLKNMGAAMAASGGLGLYHIEGITPEAKDFKEELLKKVHTSITITSDMLTALYDRLSQGRKKTDLVFIGCPHLSYDELITITKMIADRTVKRKLWINTSPNNIKKFRKSSIYSDFEKTGAEIVSICPFTLFNSPARTFKWILTNSGKMRYYSPIYYGSLIECLKVATGGDINEV